MLDDSSIVNILKDWSFWENPPSQSIPRSALKQARDWQNDLVWVIQGVRRCGKSTLLAQMISAFHLDPKQCFFVNFEDPRLSDHLNHLLLDKIVDCASRLGSQRDKCYFFFDEIQNVSRWESWIHRQVERPRNRYYVLTGSNASLLGGELATALTGRHRTIELFPFDFTEYLLTRPSSPFEQYLQCGGFPKTLTVANPGELLREYFTDIIERDARRHVMARTPQILVQLAKAVFESTGSQTSLRKLANVFDTSADTIRSYLQACTSAYLILPCPYFTFSERKRLVRPVKYYPIDTGMYRAIITRGGEDLGKCLETVVFHFLKKKFRDVFYWKGINEVDFVVQDGTTILPVQVTWDVPKDRHVKAIEEFRKQFPKADKAIVIHRNNAAAFMR